MLFYKILVLTMLTATTICSVGLALDVQLHQTLEAEHCHGN